MTHSDQSESNAALGGTGNANQNYERLRAWYLAHLRKSQLVSDIASGVTPATLIKRDREALEILIADSTPDRQLHVKSDSLAVADNDASYRKNLNPVTLIYFVNVAVSVWLLTGIGLPFTTDFTFRLAIAILLILSTVLLRMRTVKLVAAKASLSAVTQRELDIADYSQEAFFSLDASRNIVAVSPAFERLLSTPSYFCLGKSIYDLVPLRERERLKQCLSRDQQSKEVEKIETQISRHGGTVVDIELTVEYSSSDEIFYCRAFDITARKDVERLKEQLMDMLSHDLKTPLSSLRFTLALLSSREYGDLNSEGQSLVKTGESSASRLIDLINQLLDLHKLDAHQLQLSLADVNVSEIFQPALESIEKSAEQKEMTVIISAEDVFVRGDRDRLVQVLINLLSNAIKYSPEQTDITLDIKKLPGGFLTEFRVTDAGCGVTVEHRDLVFDRFYRVKAGETNSIEGTGLGLAICKAIIDAHGGTIAVDANMPAGASFYFHIPTAAG